MGNYVPNTAQQQKAMLEAIGMASYDELFSVIPDSVKLDHLDLPEGLSELEVQRLITALAAKNTVYPTIFRGAGAYRHYIPAIVKNVISKEEFITAYTPYQAEISQGILQSIFEYQTMICELTGMDVSNASVYDGASAAAEAVGMCCERKRQKVVVSAAIHPQTLAAVKTYCWGKDREVVVIPERDGITDLAALSNLLDEACACVLIQQPNYYGHLEPCEEISALAHQAGANGRGGRQTGPQLLPHRHPRRGAVRPVRQAGPGPLRLHRGDHRPGVLHQLLPRAGVLPHLRLR